MERSIKEHTSSATPVAVPRSGQQVALYDWLTEQANRYTLLWLLAHTDSGVIWGKMYDHKLHLSSEAFADQFAVVSLDWTTLQQCRLFDATGELLLWPTPDGWRARLRREDAEDGTATLCLDETYLLWGTRQENTAKGFMVLAEGSQGIVHAPPLAAPPSETSRAALLVRHYLCEDPSSGLLRISASRLVELQEPKRRPCFQPTAIDGGA